MKTKSLTVKEIIKKERDNQSSDKLLEILKTWYADGLIYFSKSKKDFIPQKPSEVYVQHQHNLNTQISTCFKKVLNHYQITDYKEKLITQFDFSKKNISLHDIIKVFEKLNFENVGGTPIIGVNDNVIIGITMNSPDNKIVVYSIIIWRESFWNIKITVGFNN